MILLMNLGSPESATAKDLKPYLTEFLMDERVIDVPLPLRTFLVKGLIVPFRSSKSAKKYASIWTPEGSPLIVHSQSLRDEMSKLLPHPVYLCMRYGNPSTRDVLKEIHGNHPGVGKIILVPLYPHYAMSSYETALVQVREEHEKASYQSSLEIVPPFYQHPSYIRALTESVRPFLKEEFDHILFSYHGIPERHVKKTDCTSTHCLKTNDCCSIASDAHQYCYRHQVIRTTGLVADQLGLQPGQYSYSFQSRLGRDAWLKPFTVTQLKEFPSKGIKKLLILCPAFVSDCLETLEEIEKEGQEDFMKAGGVSFQMIPALNENPLWLECVREMVEERKSMVDVG